MIVPADKGAALGTREKLPLFVAEVSSNHHRDLARCLAFIDRAVEIGCGAVKFQLFKIGELFAPEILACSETHRTRDRWELPVGFLPRLAERAHERGIQFACTPFYLQAVEELLPYADFYKIASYELLWTDLLCACARTGKPVVLSTGMATLDEVEKAVEVVERAGCDDLTLLHCVTGYPARVEECNLAAMTLLRDRCGVEVGWSDHSRNAGIIHRAVHRHDARLIEFHLDLDGQGEEYRMGHCWLPEEIAPVISAVAAGVLAEGVARKGPAPSEQDEREWRADPSDGLRPLLARRKTFVGDRSDTPSGGG